MYDLGNLLKHLREEKNVSMDKMIEDIKTLYSISIAKSTISKWENNKADPSMENAKILCNYFNVSLDYLLGLSKYKTKEEELEIHKSKMLEFANKHNKNFYEKNLLDSFNKLNDIGKKKVITYTKDLIEMPKYQKQIWEEEGKEYLMPNAAHEIEGNFIEEDYQHDDDIMKDDDFWNK
ncbi:helix-turn-helix domain-containing protein, partial [Clostridium sardiniense]|uniref:helix-turn-helix domain-containing protein n=1 Tax=Clostridium sardiniense TaxID=29369 RepID=UPI003D351103